MGNIGHLPGKETAGQRRPDGGPDGVLIVNGFVLLFGALTVEHARCQ